MRPSNTSHDPPPSPPLQIAEPDTSRENSQVSDDTRLCTINGVATFFWCDDKKNDTDNKPYILWLFVQGDASSSSSTASTQERDASPQQQNVINEAGDDKMEADEPSSTASDVSIADDGDDVDDNAKNDKASRVSCKKLRGIVEKSICAVFETFLLTAHDT